MTNVQLISYLIRGHNLHLSEKNQSPDVMITKVVIITQLLATPNHSNHGQSHDAILIANHYKVCATQASEGFRVLG